MTALQIIGLLAFIVALAGVLGFLFQAGKNTSSEQTEPVQEYTKEELDNIKLAEELYNKDLRPIVANKAKPVVAQELQVTEPEFIAKVVQTAKVLPQDATINAEAVVETSKNKSEFPIDKPKKKRKYHPKAKK
jgi:hypothetical protein